MIFWPCQEDEGDCPELECPFPFNLVTPTQHNTRAMEEIFCATSSSVVNELTRQGTWTSLVLCVQTSTANTRLLSWHAVYWRCPESIEKINNLEGGILGLSIKKPFGESTRIHTSKQHLLMKWLNIFIVQQNTEYGQRPFKSNILHSENIQNTCYASHIP